MVYLPLEDQSADPVQHLSHCISGGGVLGEGCFTGLALASLNRKGVDSKLTELGDFGEPGSEKKDVRAFLVSSEGGTDGWFCE